MMVSSKFNRRGKVQPTPPVCHEGVHPEIPPPPIYPNWCPGPGPIVTRRAVLDIYISGEQYEGHWAPNPGNCSGTLPGDVTGILRSTPLNFSITYNLNCTAGLVQVQVQVYDDAGNEVVQFFGQTTYVNVPEPGMQTVAITVNVGPPASTCNLQWSF